MSGELAKELVSVPSLGVPVMRQRRQLLTYLGLGTLMAGCGVSRTKPTYTLQQGIWRGRLALQIEDDREQSFSASFDLRGNAEQGRLEVINPLGNIVGQLEWGSSAAILRSGNDVRHSASLDELVEAVFGTPLPITALFAWLSGDDVQAQGWFVDLSRYGEGRISAIRQQPLPRAQLRVILASE